MIPAQNQGFVVAQTRVNRINDLVDAMVQAGIIPTSIPAERPYVEHAHRIDRLDTEFRISARVLFDVPVISVIDAEMPDPLVRLSLKIQLGEAIVETWEPSTGQRLAQFRLALSGRLAISGFAGIDTPNRAAFFMLQSFEFFLDDYTLDTPLLLPATDLALLLSRVGSREMRAKLIASGGLPEKRFPISPKIEEQIGISTPNLGLVFREPTPDFDTFEQSVCLPPHQGWPTCQLGNAPNKRFYQALDVFAGLASTAGSKPVPIDRLSRHFQIDAGRNVIDALLAKYNSDPRIRNPNGDEHGFFKVAWSFSMSIAQWQGGAQNDAGIRLSGWVRVFSRGFEVVWCEKEIKILGKKITVKYPCGFRLKWWELRTLSAAISLRPIINGNYLCIERSDLNADQDATLWGWIFDFVILPAAGLAVGGILGVFLGPIGSGIGVGLASFAVFLAIVIEMLDEILEFVVNNIAPTHACKNIEKMLELPVIENRVHLLASQPLLEFKMSGLSIALNGDFTKS